MNIKCGCEGEYDCKCGEIDQDSNSELNALLSFYISKAFEHEAAFMKDIWRGDNNDELIEFYMASERCRFTVLVDSGAHVTDTVKTSDYLDWCKER